MTATKETDLENLKIIVEFCEKITAAGLNFADEKKEFDKHEMYSDVLAFYILQIGETAKKLSQDFIEENPQIAWSEVRGMRNMLVHNYGSVDYLQVWLTVKNDIPKLENFCKNKIKTIEKEIKENT